MNSQNAITRTQYDALHYAVNATIRQAEEDEMMDDPHTLSMITNANAALAVLAPEEAVIEVIMPVEEAEEAEEELPRFIDMTEWYDRKNWDRKEGDKFLLIRGGRTGQKLHYSYEGTSCALGCGRWFKVNVSRLAVDLKRVPVSALCDKCFSGGTVRTIIRMNKNMKTGAFAVK